MTNLCVNCDHMDQASKEKWRKANEKAEAETTGEIGELIPIVPTFDSWKPYCMLFPRQSTLNKVAGLHINGPPYISCKKIRDEIFPDECPHFTAGDMPGL